MKKTIGLLFVLGLCLLVKPCIAQEEYVMEELETYYKELVDFDKKIDSTNVENYETRFEINKKFGESCINEYMELIRSDKGLKKLYEKYIDLQTSLEKRMKELKEQKVKKELKEKLTSKFQGYLDQLEAMENQGLKLVENKRIDSLEMVKKDAIDCYQKALVDYGSNRNDIEEDKEMNALWSEIEQVNKRITALSIVPAKFQITGDAIFKICIALVAVILGVTTITSRVKMNKMQKPQKPKKPKKQEEDIPSI